MQRLCAENSLLTDNALKRLSRNGIHTLLDFIQEETEKVSTLTKLQLADVLVIRANILKKYSASLTSANSILSKESRNFMSTGVKKLDQVMAGGIPVGCMTELCGLADSGKTQLCLQLALVCAKQQDSCILYIDTKGDFSALRIQKILEINGYSHKDMALIMYKIRVIHIWTMEEMIDILTKLVNNGLVIENLRLIIIDSLPTLMYQYLGDESKVGLSSLNLFANHCKYLCKNLELSIICVNIQTRWVEQEVADLDDEADMTAATKDHFVERKFRCLGKYWQHIPALVLQIEKSPDSDNLDNQSEVTATIIKSNYCKVNMSCSLTLNSLGVS